MVRGAVIFPSAGSAGSSRSCTGSKPRSSPGAAALRAAVPTTISARSAKAAARLLSRLVSPITLALVPRLLVPPGRTLRVIGGTDGLGGRRARIPEGARMRRRRDRRMALVACGRSGGLAARIDVVLLLRRGLREARLARPLCLVRHRLRACAHASHIGRTPDVGVGTRAQPMPHETQWSREPRF